MISKPLIRRVLQCYFVSIVALLVVLMFVSWVMSIYIDGVEGLLTSRGIRWMCSNIIANFASVPLAEILLGLMAIGVLHESGLIHAFRGHTSLKQKRALEITGISFVVIVCLFSLLLLLPHAVLLSAFGTFSHSPFSKGAYGLAACVVIFIGNIYGYTSGKFVTLHDFLAAHTRLLSSVANYFVLLFLSSQFVCCLQFTGILELIGDNTLLSTVIGNILYYFPLFLYLVLAV